MTTYDQYGRLMSWSSGMYPPPRDQVRTEVFALERNRVFRGLGEISNTVTNGGAVMMANNALAEYTANGGDASSAYFATVAAMRDQFAAQPQHAYVDLSQSTALATAIAHLNPPWLQSHTLSGGGFLTNAAMLGIGAGVVAIVGSVAWFFMRGRR